MELIRRRLSSWKMESPMERTKRKRRKKKKKSRKDRKIITTSLDIEIKKEEEVEIEYVAANPLEQLDPNDPMFQEFANIFQRFNPDEGDEEGTNEETVESNKGGEDGETEEGGETLSKKQKKKRKET